MAVGKPTPAASQKHLLGATAASQRTNDSRWKAFELIHKTCRTGRNPKNHTTQAWRYVWVGVVFIAGRNPFDKDYLLRRNNWKMWFDIQVSINCFLKYKIHLTYKPRLKENSKGWQFKSHQTEVLWNRGKRNTGLEGTLRGSSSLQANSDPEEPQWLRTSLLEKPIPTFRHPSQQVGIKQQRTVRDEHNAWEALHPKLDCFSHLLFSLDRTTTDRYPPNQNVLQT